MIGARILVTPRSVTKTGHPALDRLRAAGFEVITCTAGQMPGEDELLRILPGCVGYLAGVEKVTARVLEAAAELKVIARNGTGVDSVDVETAQRLGIKVCRAEGANARGVAELTLGLILALARGIPSNDRAIKDGSWERQTGAELEGKTLGLIGCGRIGKLVAHFALAMGMQVLAYDALPDHGFMPASFFRYASLQDVLREADVISLHCPMTTGSIIDATSIKQMKRGVLLVNTARAELVERGPLAAALESGHLGGYGVDVYAEEPPVGDHWLASDRVVATAHVGGLTQQSVDRAMHLAVDHLLRELRG